MRPWGKLGYIISSLCLFFSFPSLNDPENATFLWVTPD